MHSQAYLYWVLLVLSGRVWKLWEGSEARRWLCEEALHWFLAINSPTTNIISVRHVGGAGCLQSERFLPSVKAKGGRARVTVATQALELLAFLPATHSWGMLVWLLSGTAGTNGHVKTHFVCFFRLPTHLRLYVHHKVMCTTYMSVEKRHIVPGAGGKQEELGEITHGFAGWHPECCPAQGGMEGTEPLGLGSDWTLGSRF